MKFRFCMLSVFAALMLGASALFAQELGRGSRRSKTVSIPLLPTRTTTTCSFVVTQEGVVMIDSCNSPLDSRQMLAAIKKLPISRLFFDRYGNPQ